MSIRRVFTFDMDGVVADIGYVPVMERQRTTYAEAKPLLPAWFFAQLQRVADVYVISARSFQNATHETRQWMRQYFSDAERVGVLCNILPKDKAHLVNILHATYHFDDHPLTVKECGRRGVLVDIVKDGWNNPYSNLQTVRTWSEIWNLCTLPTLGISYNPEQASLF